MRLLGNKPRLSAKAVRDEFTSRECARMLAGAMWTLLRREDSPGAGEMRYAVITACRIHWNVRLDLVNVSTVEGRCKLVVDAWLGSLAALASEEAVGDALLWWAEHDDAWLVFQKRNVAKA